MLRLLTAILIVCVFAGCHRRNAELKPNQRFTLPLVNYTGNTSNAIKPFVVDSVDGVYPRLVGKYKFTGELNFGNEVSRLGTIYANDFISEYSYEQYKERDSITTDGFQIFADYKTTIKVADDGNVGRGVYYPVYLVNETNRTKLFIGKDRHAFAIQEAQDTARYRYDWKAIEAKGFDFCGNGYFGLKVHPGEFVMFLAKKYAGPDTTLMRIRAEVGEHVYISQPFTGSLSFKQFRVGEGMGNSHHYLNVYYNYHGALPKNIEEENKYIH